MITRDAITYQSLKRVPPLIERHEALRLRAAESQALDRLKEHIAQIGELAETESTADLTSQGLRKRRDAIKHVLVEQLEAVRLAAEYSIAAGTLVPVFTPPLFGDDVIRFATDAKGIANVAGEHEEALRRAGLDWSIIADIKALAENLLQAHTGRHGKVAERRGANTAIPIVLRAGRRQVALLKLQLKPVMTPDMLAEWSAAVSLGRKHRATRPAQLSAPPAARQLPSPAAAELPPAVEAKPLGIADTAKRFVLRLIRAERKAHAPAPSSDVSVEEIRRLPSSTETTTGTDGTR